jgi:hypothetical protein
VNNLRLINVLRTFSKTELKEFEKFVSSPFFNKGRNYIPFLNQLKKFYPKFDNEKLTQEYIYEKLYPGKKFNKQIIWNMTSSMMYMAEEFLMQLGLRKNQFVRSQQIAGELHDRKLSSYNYKKLNEMETHIDKMGIDDNYFRYKTMLEIGRMNHHFNEDSQHLLREHVIRKGEYSIMNFMRDIADVISNQRSMANMYNINFEVNVPLAFVQNLQLDKIVDYAYNNKFKHAAVLETYYRIIMMVLDDSNSVHFFRYKELFEQNYTLFPYNEKYYLAAEMSNYAVSKVNAGDQSFRKTIFEIDKFKLKEGLLYQEKYFPKVLFVQIFANAMRAGELEWSKNFVDEYLHFLKPAYQKPVKALAWSSIYFLNKQFGKSLEELGKVKFIDSVDKLYARFYYIRIYYELNEIEMLHNYIDSTRHFLNNNTSIGSLLINNYIRFLAAFTRFIAAKETGDDFELSKIRKTIDDDDAFPLKEWFYDKLDELNINSSN